MCGGCNEIVDARDAIKCSACEKVDCSKCLKKWHQTKLLPLNMKESEDTRSCMHCRHTPYVPAKLTRIEKSTLDNLEFKCPLCSEDVKYENTRYHTLFGCKMRPKKTVCCPANCGVEGIID